MKNWIPLLLISVLFHCAACDVLIGDSCAYDADCSPNGDRNCDNGQPGGYCLSITCGPDTCPHEAACVEFLTPSPDFSAETDDVFTASAPLYDSLNPNRARTYCLKQCKDEGDCRDDYHCAKGDELRIELNAVLLDYKSSEKGFCAPGKNPPSYDTDSESDSDSDTDSDTDSATD